MEEESAITQDLSSVISTLNPLPYFILDESNSLTASRQRTFSAAAVTPAANSPIPIRNKSLSFDLGLSASSNIQKKLNADTNEIHSEEGYSINEQIFQDEKLYSIYNKAKKFRDHMYDEETELSDEFMDAFTIVEDLIDIREAIKCKEWIKARTVCLKLENELVGTQYDKVTEELSINKSLIVTFAIIHTSFNIIKAGLNFGPVGMPDYKTISLDALDEALGMFEIASEDVQLKLEILKSTLQSLFMLRKAQKQGNWKEIAVALEKIHSDLIAFKVSDMILIEISKATIEKENNECITALKNALMNEEIFCKDSVLDTEQISVKDLTAAIAKISQMPEESRGIILKPLHILSDCVLKARKAAAQKNWYVLESVLPVLKENIDNFQNEIDGKDRLVLHRKTLALRASNLHRGTMMVKDRAGSGKMSIMDNSNAGAGGMLVRSATWEEYAEVNQSIKREIKVIEHHFAVKELEKTLPEKLARNGIQANNNDNTINIQNIQIDELQEILDYAGTLESSNLSLPTTLKATRKIGLLVVKLRTAVINNKWDEINSVLEETMQLELSQMPEYNRVEIQIVRREVENRWIIQNLTSAIMSGSLQLDGDSWQVSSQHLPSFIQTVRSLQPRSEQANFLCFTGERILELRELLQPSKAKSDVANVIPWKTVTTTAKKIETEITEGKLHSMIAPEVTLCLQIAHDRQICEQLEQAVVSGAISGDPGNIQYGGVSTSLLAKTCKQTSMSSLKSVYSQVLYEVAKQVYQLRETSLYFQEVLAKSSQSDSAYDSVSIKSILVHINRIISELYNMKSKHKSLSVWKLCDKEISLVEKHMLLEELRHALIDTVNKASYLYSMKHNEQIKDFLKIEQSDSYMEQYRILFVELDQLIHSYEKFATNSQYDFLQKFVHCATTLRMLRSSILDENWNQLETLLKNDLFVQALNIIPEVAGEHSWIVCELHNSIAWSSLYDALYESVNDGELKYDIHSMKIWEVETFQEKQYHKRNQLLLSVLDSLKQYHITAVRSQQALTCCTHLYTIRHHLYHILPNIIDSTTYSNSDMIKKQNSGLKTSLGAFLSPNTVAQYQNELVQAFSWFHSHPLDCIPCIKLEVQQAFVFFQNILFVQSFKLALKDGKPQGKCGETNRELIKTNDIENLITQSDKMPSNYRLQMLNQLLAAAKLALRIRTGLLNDDYESLQDIMDEIQLLSDEYDSKDGSSNSNRSINFYILEEISIARTEIDNSKSCNALIKALKSFKHPQLGYLRCVFIQSFQKDHCKSCSVITETAIPMVLVHAVKELMTSLKDGVVKQRIAYLLADLPSDASAEEIVKSQMKTQNASVPTSPSTMVRHSSYFYAQSAGSTFDVNNAILSQGVTDNNDINPLDKGMRISLDHGITSSKAKKLVNTVLLIKVLRLALRSGQWQLINEILSIIEFDHFVDEEYHVVGLMEIECVSLQCRICQILWKMNNLLDCSYWVKINHGMVKEAANAVIINEELLFSLQLVEQLLHQLLQLFKNPSSDEGDDDDDDDSDEESSDIVNNFMMPMIQEHILPFIQSTKLIYAVRELLLIGQCYEAGKLAFQHLQLFSSPTSSTRGLMNGSPMQSMVGTLPMLSNEQFLVDHLHANVMEELGYYQEELYFYLQLQQRIKSLQDIFNTNQISYDDIQSSDKQAVEKAPSLLSSPTKLVNKNELITNEPQSKSPEPTRESMLLYQMEKQLIDFYQISPNIFSTKNLGFSALFVDYFGYYEALGKCKDEIQKHKTYLLQSIGVLSDRSTLTARWFPELASTDSSVIKKQSNDHIMSSSTNNNKQQQQQQQQKFYPNILESFLKRYQRMSQHYHDDDVIYLQSQYQQLQQFVANLTSLWVEFVLAGYDIHSISVNAHVSNIITQIQQTLTLNYHNVPIIHTHPLTAHTKLLLSLATTKSTSAATTTTGGKTVSTRKSVSSANSRSSFTSIGEKADKLSGPNISMNQYILSHLQLEKTLLLCEHIDERVSPIFEEKTKNTLHHLLYNHTPTHTNTAAAYHTNNNNNTSRVDLRRLLCVEGLIKFSIGYKQQLYLHLCLLKATSTATATTIKPSQFHELTAVHFQECFPLQSFKKLRNPEDYSYRRNLQSVELQSNFLSYSNQSLPTSLTVLPAYLATIAVFAYSRYIQAFEHCNFSYPEFLLHHLVTIGCHCVRLRDEIYCQLMKQLTYHPDYIQYCQHLQQTLDSLLPIPATALNPIMANVIHAQGNNNQSNNSDYTSSSSSTTTHAMILFRIEKVLRLWKLFTVCLYYFPPSEALENIVECFLYRHLVEYQSILQKKSCQPGNAITTLPTTNPTPPGASTSSTTAAASNPSSTSSAAAKKRMPDHPTTHNMSNKSMATPIQNNDVISDSYKTQKENAWQEFSPYFKGSISWMERSLRYLHRSVCLYGYKTSYPLSHCHSFNTVPYQSNNNNTTAMKNDSNTVFTNELSDWIRLDINYDPSDISEIKKVYKTATATTGLQ